MAGATGSGQEMQTGRTNRAEGRTILWAQVPPGQANFNGPAILIVEVARDAEDPDDYEAGEHFVPDNQFDGIVATGFSGGSPSKIGGTPGGAGVIGNGGRNQGTGVVGFGSGPKAPHEGGGEGGIGVHGFGGAKAPFFADVSIPPGAGVVGQGGRQDDNDNKLQLPHAAGVIGIAGGIGPKTNLLLSHTLVETGGVGVYGQGAEATVTMVTTFDENGTRGPDVPSGPLAPGPGVVGRGGVSKAPRSHIAAGVIGLAAGVPIPDISETSSSGVYGAGPAGVTGRGEIGVNGVSTNGAGVRGQTDYGTGVYGVSNSNGRGGVFQSADAAQVQLAPARELRVPFPAPVAVTPNEIPLPKEIEDLQLPRDGRGGDLLVLMDNQKQCALWFCVRSMDTGPAQWAQVLLGTTFDGRS